MNPCFTRKRSVLTLIDKLTRWTSTNAPLFPFVAFFYNGFSVSGRHGGTLGMRMMDIEMQLIGGGRVPFIIAAIHAVLFYFSWMFPPILLVSLFTHDKRCLHDIFSGVIVIRRPY